MSSEHVSSHDFAAFLDGACDDDACRRVHEHLAACPECLDAYRDALRVLGTPLPDEYARLSARVAAQALSPGGSSARRTGARWRPGVLIGAAIIAAILLVRETGRENSFDPFAPELAPITESMIGYGGQLMFPGTEAHVPDSPSTYRSTGSRDDPAVAESLRSLLERFKKGEITMDESYWLAAGYASRGDDGIAREVIEVSRARSRDDPRFYSIEAILAYRNNDLRTARARLEAAVAAAPRSAEAHYNLSVVLEELGKSDLARRHLTRAREYAAGPVIRARGR